MSSLQGKTMQNLVKSLPLLLALLVLGGCASFGPSRPARTRTSSSATAGEAGS